MRHWAEYAVLRVVGGAISVLPRRMLWRVSGAVAIVISACRLARVRVAEDNLRAAFPEYDLATIRTIARQSVRNLLQTVAEIPFLARASRDRIASLFRMVHLEMARDRIREHGGIIIVSAHYGNWELAALAAAMHLGAPLTIIGKPQRNPHVDRYLTAMRERFGNHMVPMHGAVRFLVRAITSGASLAILADQSGDAHDLMTPFFGRLVPTTTAVAALSLKFNIPIVISVARRDAHLGFVAELVEIDRTGLPGDHAERVLVLTERHVAALESIIREEPGQWLWMHRRWKFSPHAGAA